MKTITLPCHEIEIRLLITDEEARRIVGGARFSRKRLADILEVGLTSNATNAAEFREIEIDVDGKAR